MSEARLARIGQALCFAGAGVGALGVLGWILGRPDVLTIIPGKPPMKLNTAIGLLLLGVAAAIQVPARARGARRTVSLAISILVLALCIATLVEYATGVDLHIDQISPDDDPGPYPGRPSPPSAIAELLLAGALLTFDVRPTERRRPSEWLAVLAGVIAFTALTGLLFGVGALYRMYGSVLGVALPTAIGTLLIVAGMLLERPAAGMMRVLTSRTPGGALLRGLVPLAIVSPIVLGLAITWVSSKLDVANELSFVTPLLTATMAIVGLGWIAIIAASLDRTHRALESTRAQASDLVEHAPEGIFVADVSGRYTDVNAAGARMLGYDREEILGKTITDLVAPEDAERLMESKHRMLEGQVEVGAWTLRRRDGTPLSVEVSARILDGRWQAVVRDISERKELEAALRERTEDLERAQTVARVGSWRMDRDGEAILSAEMARIVDAPQGVPLTYAAFLERVHPDDRAFIDRKWAAALRGEPYDIEHRVIVRGEIKWLREKAELELDEHGAVRRCIGITQDITELKLARDRVLQTQERLELALRGADLATWDWNVQTGELVFNARWAAMRGYQLGELAPHVWSFVSGIHPDDRERVQVAVAAYLDGRVPEYEAEFRIKTRSGEWIWILDRGKLFVRDDHGRPLRMVGVGLDITERKRLEHEQRFLAEVGRVMAETLDYDETIANIATLAVQHLADVCILDLVGDGETTRRVTNRDPALSEAADLLAGARRDPSHPLLIDAVLATRRTFFMDHLTAESLAELVHGEQQQRAWQALAPRSVLAVPLVMFDRLLGAITLVVSHGSAPYTASDVWLAEVFAQRAALSIESAMLYRTATRAISSRDEVLAIVAHDLRNPLHTIDLQAELLREGGQGRTSEVIARATTRMNRLIQDLLDVTRLEAGALLLEKVRMPAAPVVREVVEAERSIAASASLAIELDVAADLPDIAADRVRIQQVLDNLIGNAVKFTGGGGRITVGARARGHEVLFWVTDTGVGISEEDLPHLFDRFWQARKTRGHGAGLGLAIVKGLVDQHGGRIWVESTPGRGSAFYFTIPTAPPIERSLDAHAT